MRLIFMAVFMSLVLVGRGEIVRHYVTRSTMPVDSMLVVDMDARSCIVEARAAISDNTPRRGLSRQWWGLEWREDGVDAVYTLRLQCGNTDFGDITDERYAVVSLSVTVGGEAHQLMSRTLKRGIDCYDGYNSLALEWNTDSTLSVGAGKGKPKLLCTVPGHFRYPRQVKIVADGSIDVDMAVVETDVNRLPDLDSGMTPTYIAGHLALSSDPIEGYWRYLDRETDDTMLRLGGEYRLAAIRDGDGYLLIYIDGARVNDVAWTPGMIKGRLLPTPFVNHYNLVWYDSLLSPIDRETYATADGTIMTLEFPLYNRSSIRLYREP